MYLTYTRVQCNIASKSYSYMGAGGDGVGAIVRRKSLMQLDGGIHWKGVLSDWALMKLNADLFTQTEVYHTMV